MKYHFCTCFDNNYLIYGCVLYDSLRRSAADFTLYIVCLDETVRENLATLGWPEAVLIPLSEIEADDPEYAATAATRSRGLADAAGDADHLESGHAALSPAEIPQD